jgi:hypothetical protein
MKKPEVVVPKHPIQKLDLRKITRDSNKCRTYVTLHWDWQTKVEWIICGMVDLRDDNPKEDRRSRLIAYLSKGATDFEHDSAHALGLPLIGLTFDHLWYQRAVFTAWIDPNDDDNGFRVPQPGYDPAKLKDTIMCEDKRCDEKHIIVPEGYYYPPHNADLYDLVKGKRVEISIGPVFKDEDE